MRLLLSCLSLLLLLACQQAEKEGQSFAGNKMEMPYKVILAKAGEEEKVKAIIDESFAEIDRVFNRWNPQSELSKLNQLAAGVKSPLSKELRYLLELADKAYKISGKRFDPSVKELSLLWKKRLKEGKRPSLEEIDKLKNHQWESIHFEQDFYKDSEVEIDLDGIAKGHALDLLSENLYKAGFVNHFVEWGGEIKARGKHPSGRSWRIFISKLGLTSPSDALDFVEIEEQAIATSGDYMQFWMLNDAKETKIYSHIVDPRTKQAIEVAADNVASCSILTESCAFADALATAAMLFPKVEDAKLWLEEVKKTEKIDYWLLSRDEK